MIILRQDVHTSCLFLIRPLLYKNYVIHLYRLEKTNLDRLIEEVSYFMVKYSREKLNQYFLNNFLFSEICMVIQNIVMMICILIQNQIVITLNL
jgi:hypothetical protein